MKHGIQPVQTNWKIRIDEENNCIGKSFKPNENLN
jgi:hypothetical protein